MLKTHYTLDLKPSIQPFSLKIPVKMMYFNHTNTELVVPEFVFNHLDNVYVTVIKRSNAFDISSEFRFHESLYGDFNIYLQCDSEIECIKMKLRL